jgi:hypothetical protein
LTRTIFLLIVALLASVSLTPADYVQCRDPEPDEYLDFLGTLDRVTKGVSHLIAYPVSFLRSGVADLSESSFLQRHFLIGISESPSPRTADLSPVLRI